MDNRCAETLFFNYHRQNGVDIRVVRIFNTYGPRMLPDDGWVASHFIVQALKGQDLGIGLWCAHPILLCHVDDLIEGVVLPDEPSEPDNPGQYRQSR